MVAVMRELGVQACDGIVLGPPPTKLEVLERKADAGEVIDAEELAAERRRQKIAAARQEIRDKVGADLSDEECDRFIKPEAA
jgi:hypothetical protein